MHKLAGTVIAAVLGALVSGVAAWGLVSSVSSAPSANPAKGSAPIVYGSR